MVLVRTFIAVIKHHDHGEERVSFSVQFHNTLITEGSQGRHLRQELIKRPQRGAAYRQPAVLYTPTHQHHQTKGGPVHSEQGPFFINHQSRTDTTGFPTAQSGEGIFSTEFLFPHMTLVWVKVAYKLASTAIDHDPDTGIYILLVINLLKTIEPRI